MSDTKEVEATTDNLDDFNELLNGKAVEPEKQEEVVEVENPEEVVEEDETETDTLANDETDDGEAEEDDQTEDAEEDDDPEAEEVEEEAPKAKKKTAQERINEITAARREAERKADMLEGRLAEMERQLSKGESKEDNTVVEEASPTPEDKNEDGTDKYDLGEFDPEYIRDLTRYTIKVETDAARVEQEKQNQQNSLNSEQQAIQEVWQDSVVVAEEKHEDFSESVAGLESTFSSLDQDYASYLANTIMQSDNGADVLYHLSKNTDLAQEIVDSGATKATLAIGRLSAQFAETEKPAAPTAKVTKAKAPPIKRSRGSGSKKPFDAATDDLDAFEKEFFK